MSTSSRAGEFWAMACNAVPSLPREAAYQVWYFGDNAALSRDLAGLVLRGRKRATAGLLWDVEADPGSMPVLCGYSVVTDIDGAPLMVLRTDRVETRAYRDVDADFAAAEAEGDGSLAYWRAAHWRYFSRRCEALGRTVSEDMPVVLERFSLIYPMAE